MTQINLKVLDLEEEAPLMSSAASPVPYCQYCRAVASHTALNCPRVRAVEYHPDGILKRIEFHEEWAQDVYHPTPVDPHG